MAETDPLELPIGLTEKQFLRQLARIENRLNKTAGDVDRKFRATNQRVSRGFRDLQRSSSRSFSGISAAATRAAASIAAMAGSLVGLQRYADAYVTVENRLRSIGQTSDQAAEDLLAASIRSRAGIEEMSTAVARFEKATGDGFEVAVRRIETLNKLLAVGGATTQEMASVMTQLSQALTSGQLMGEELRSLRENAPIEVLDAIAEAAGSTRGQLKQLGEEGRLTAEVVVTALDNLASTADDKFGQTTQTIGQAFTNINSALVTFVGRLNEGLGASEALTDGLVDLATWLSNNLEEAEEFGRSLRATLETIDEYGNKFDAWFDAISEAINTAAANLGGFDEAITESGGTFIDAISQIISAIAEMNGVIEGAAGATREAFFVMVDAVSGGVDAAIKAVITGVETMVNKLLDGVRRVVGVISLFNPGAFRGASEALSGGFSIGDVPDIGTNLSTRGVGQAAREDYEAGKARVNDFFKGVKDAYNQNLTERQIYDDVDLSLNLDDLGSPSTGSSNDDNDPDTGDGGGGSGSGGKSRSGRNGRKKRPFFEDIEKNLVNLQREIELVGKSNEEVAEARARWELLDQAKKRGIPVNEELNAQINAQAAEVGRLTGELERAEIAQQQFEDAIDGIADAMAGALVAGESLREGLAEVFKGIAADLLRSGIHRMISGLANAFIGSVDPLAGALRGAGLNAIPSFGGFRASGGPVSTGKSYIVGEDGPELFSPKVNGAILNAQQVSAMDRRQNSGATLTFAPSVTMNGGATEADRNALLLAMQDQFERGFLPMLRKKFPQYNERFG